MTMPNNTVADAAPKNGGAGRRIAAATIVGVLLFSVLWYTVFSAVTAAMVASGGAVILVAGSAASDTFETVFDMLANILLSILSAIGAFFAGIFSLFDW